MNKILLYYRPTCPYCAKVLEFMRENGIELKTKNLEKDPAIRQELIEIGGKGQIPCLVMDGKAMYESDNIIDWLKDNKVNT